MIIVPCVGESGRRDQSEAQHQSGSGYQAFDLFINHISPLVLVVRLRAANSQGALRFLRLCLETCPHIEPRHLNPKLHSSEESATWSRILM